MKGFDHFDIDGLNVYADVERHEEQVGDYARMIEPISAHMQIHSIYIGDQEVLNDVIFEAIEEEILRQMGEQY